jgi:hypothetical protein
VLIVGLPGLCLAGPAAYLWIVVPRGWMVVSPALQLACALGLLGLLGCMIGTLPWERRKTCPDCGHLRR